MKFFKFKRLKIVEQMIFVILISVLIPLVTAFFIVNNVNQHAIRNELQYSATMINDIIVQNINAYLGSDKNALKDIAYALKFIPQNHKKKYLHDISQSSSDFKDLKIIYSKNIKKNIYYDEASNMLIICEKLNNNNYYLLATIDVEVFKNKIFSTIKDNMRQIYIIDSTSNQLIASHNFSINEYQNVIKSLPTNILDNKQQLFGKVKNEPKVYYKMTNPDFLIITNTTEKKADNTIYKSRVTIILTILFAGLSVIGIIGLYTYYLYINIRQLFKGIMALSKGNYKRKIRLLTNFLTPYEIVFLAFEFNKMVYEVNIAYRKLKQNNRELEHLNEFRSNLLDTVSHELRTPLTSIMGYTSRLLRNDIEIDEQTKIKSLKVIKRQSERLSRMVEDLLIIPDIERKNLNIELTKIDLNRAIDVSLQLIKDFKNHNFILKTQENISVLANEDRLEQVIINLLENASKYAYDESDIKIKTYEDGSYGIVEITNQADYIDNEMLKRLKQKFIRLDDKTTRTTRGSGLGLFIVEGLIDAMGGKFVIESKKDNSFTVIVKLKK